MRNKKLIILTSVILCFIINFKVLSQNQIADLKMGKYKIGFRLIEQTDSSRTILNENNNLEYRTIRIYVWYPATDDSGNKMLFNDYIKLAKDDFYKKNNSNYSEPTQLINGLSEESLNMIKAKPSNASYGAEYLQEKFPVIILGQGLYYESPLSQYILSEFLASNGYVVVTCPLKGTQYRLVNLNVIDLETIVRDLEFSLSKVLSLAYVDKDKIGVIGYDMGGMAGIIYTMRHSEVKAFLSIDSGVLYKHYSGLPNNHPNYDISKLNVPWLHLSQARFYPGGLEKARPENAMKQKLNGDSYLMLINTTNHGSFTSYAMMGIENPVQGYWGTDFLNMKPVYETTCNNTLEFLDSYIKGDKISKENLYKKIENNNIDVNFELIRKDDVEITQEMIINKMINQDVESAILIYNKLSKEKKGNIFWDENKINWLGYHFLYWWDRKDDALKLFEFITELFPTSANAFDSLAEAFYVSGDFDKAKQYYQKSLEINPNNENAKQILKTLNSQ